MSKSARRLRAELVDRLRIQASITSDAVADALSTVPRECFVPEVAAKRGLAAVYRDEALVTKKDARGMPLSSSSQPALMTNMLELLDLGPAQRVLEIGTGTGYNSALLSHLVGPRGRVTSVDVDPELASKARRALRESGLRASVVVADGRLGFAKEAPYDRIIVTASAGQIPRAWLEQLCEGGRLVVPLRLDPGRSAIQVIPVLERRGERLRSAELTWGSFMPLHGGDGGWAAPPGSLTASLSAGGKRSSLASISGAVVSSLSEVAARKVLASILEEGGTPIAQGRLEMSSTQPPLLLIYLLTKIPDSRRVAMDGNDRLGVGLMDRRTRSVAVLSVRSPWFPASDRTKTHFRWRIDTYGGDAAAAELIQLVEQWRTIRRAAHDRLRITAYGRGAALRLRFSWSAS